MDLGGFLLGAKTTRCSSSPISKPKGCQKPASKTEKEQKPLDKPLDKIREKL